MVAVVDGLPSVRRIRAVQRRLRRQQGPFEPKPRLEALDEVVATVLSQHTSDRNSERAFASLKRRFPTWEEVLDAPVGEVADAIRSGGIADQKAARIQRLLAMVEEREGRAERAHQLLARRVPADIRYDLHLGLVTHGRAVCKAQRPPLPHLRPPRPLRLSRADRAPRDQLTGLGAARRG